MQRNGQSLIEVLVAIGVGTIMLVGAITALSPALKSSADVGKAQMGSALAKELLENVRVWSEGNWHNLDSLATSSANKYFLNTAPLGGFAVATGTESIAANGAVYSLVSYWKMDDASGTAPMDFSTTGANTTFTGTPSATSTCSLGKCYYFGGSTDGLLAASGPNLSTSSFTISNWINTSANSAQMYSVDSISSNQGYAIGLSSGNIAYFIGQSGSSSSGTCGTALVNDGKWHLVTGVFNRAASSTFDCYLDGKKLSSATLSGAYPSMPSSGAQVAIGNLAGCCAAFRGYVDDARIYNRALSATEIQSLYNAVAFSRDFYLEDVYRDASGFVAASGGLDPSTKKVTVEYYWGSVPVKTLSMYVTRWMNKSLWQTDWAGGANISGPSSTTKNTFATSSGIDFSTTTGSIRIQGI